MAIFNGIIFILLGLSMIYFPKTECYQNYIEYHRFGEREEIIKFFRSIFQWIFIAFGIIIILLKISTFF